TDAQNGVMYVKNSIEAGVPGYQVDSVRSNGTFNPALFFSSNNNRSFATVSEVSLIAPFDLNNPNFLPLSNSPALTDAGTPTNDGFFDPAATFVGAFGTDDWTFGWARFNPDITTDVKEIRISSSVPDNYNLSQNYPNPFNPSTRISYSVVEPTNVKLSVYNILGQQVAILVNDFKNTGTYEVNFNASSLSSGVYIYSLEAGKVVVSKKMTLLK
ncbi:MAG: T9SS type A sorting domain-containing protein, partial [Ignavibacteriaceae bacterium]